MMNGQFLHNAGTVTKVIFARLRFLSVFIFAALIIGYWDNIKNHIDKWTRPAVAPELLTDVSKIEYYCSMHPSIVREEPGQCPICGMPLIKREKGKATTLPDDVLARVQLSPQRIALANVQTSGVEYKSLVHEIRALGVLDYNETKLSHLSARVAGRADELFIDFTGQSVKEGDPVYSLFSPEVYTAQREYLLARKRVNELSSDANAQLRADASAVYNATMQKLVLWGVTSQQLEQMEHGYDQTGQIPTHLIVTSPMSGIVIEKDIHQGHYVQVGEDPYTLADLRTLWLRAKIYENDVPLVHIGQETSVVVEAFPNEVFKGAVAFMSFQLDPQTRTLDARIEVKNEDLRLRPGMFADAVVRVPVSAEMKKDDGSDDSDHSASQPSHLVQAESGATVFLDAVQPYLRAQKLLSQDKIDGVSAALHESLNKLEPIKSDPKIAEAFGRFEISVHATMGQELAPLRDTFKEVSLAMIEIGKATRLPGDAPNIQVFRCPMKKANWLQEAGTPANPFYGSMMLDCGGPVETLPKVEAMAMSPTTHPAGSAGKVLAIPRSAVIDTGRRKIVYVESSPGVFDMREVQIGGAAGDDFPVVSGLSEGERVVTVGGFLIDSENRLNPTVSAPASDIHQH